MRIHRISLTNYRGVRSCDVELASDGVTIIEGDNEVGKSSLAEAVDLVLTQPDTSKSKRVRAVVPVGLDEGPEVAVEVSTGPYRFTYRKRWHRKAHTILDVTEPRREQLTGREAHDRVRQLLDETLDDALFAALRVEQIGLPDQASFGETSLGRVLDRCAGVDLAGDREDGLWDRVHAEYLRHWTATGLVRGDRKERSAAVDAARAEVDRLRAEVRSLDDDAAEVERLDAAIRDTERAVDEHRRTADGFAARWEAVELLRADVDRLGASAAAAEGSARLAVADQERRRSLVERVTAAQAAVQQAEDDRARTDSLRSSAEVEADAAELLAERARAALDEAEAVLRRATADEDLHADRAELDSVEERRRRVLVAQQQLSAADAVVEAIRVEPDVLARIEAARLDLARAEAAEAAGAATVTTTALAATTVVPDGGAGEELPPCSSRTDVVSSSIHLVVPGSVEIRVVAGAGAQQRARRAAAARDALRALCDGAGIADPDEARPLAERRTRALADRDAALAVIGAELQEPTLDALDARIERLAKRIAERDASRRVDDGPLPHDHDAARQARHAAERRLDDARSTLRRLDDDARDAAARLSELRVQSALVEGRAGSAAAVLAAARAELADARDAEADEHLAERVAALTVQESQVRAEVRRAEASLADADPEGVELLLCNAREVLERAERRLAELAARRTELRAELRARGELGLQQQLDDAVTRRDRLEFQYQRGESRARAAQLLNDTFEHHRAEARQRYVAPFRERIERFGRLVFGPDLEVELDDDLRICRRTLDGVTLDFEQLSVGAREQLTLIARLACAAIVSDDGGAPVIFDDALGWTDPARLSAMGAAIALAGRECQVVVLTCSPGRYAGVGNAKVVRLPSG